MQRVAEARVAVGEEIVGEIGAGLCVFVGVGREDGDKNAEALADKLSNLRVFEDDQGKMNALIIDRGGEVLVIRSSRCTATAAGAIARRSPLPRRPIRLIGCIDISSNDCAVRA